MRFLTSVRLFFLSLVFFTFTSVDLARAASADFLSELSQKMSTKMQAFYQDLHRTPEISGEEKETSKKVAQEMRAMGLEVIDGIGGYGVIGILRNGAGPTTWVRAELDALPVEEETGATFKSQTPGKMHACGHDFHMTMVLATAHVMIESKSEWKGTLVFIGQPAEEVGRGAKAMIKDGLLKKAPKPDQILAVHTSGLYKKGTVAILPGYGLANVDSVDVIFKGRGSHGARPEGSIDPFIMTAEYVLKMQTLLGREKKATKAAVISVGSIHGGTKYNIIPDHVKLQLTVRSYDPEVRTMIKKRMVEIAQGIAKTNGAPEPEVSFPEEADAMYNDPALTARVRKALEEKLGAESVTEAEQNMGGEDFGQFGMAAKVPSLMFWIGEQNEKDPKISSHSPLFLPDYAKTAPLAVRAISASLLDLHRK